MSTDRFIIITLIAGHLYKMTGDPGPGYRKLLELCANAVLTPPFQKRNGRWGCVESEIPRVAELLALRLKTLPSVSAPRAQRSHEPGDHCLSTVPTTRPTPRAGTA
jgi:hypothetical protein